MKTIPLLTIMVTSVLSLAADEYYEKYLPTHNDYSHSYIIEKNQKEQRLYTNECGACHMAYQPEFLPKRSWNAMMQNLSDHFGVDATLEQDDFLTLSNYIKNHAGDAKRVARDFAKTVYSIAPEETPLRISQTRYFKKEHRKLHQRLINQPDVKSIANCNACHTSAKTGNYDEHNIVIPNYGRWND